MGEIVIRGHQGALIFVLEPGLDVLGVNSLKNTKKLYYLICGSFVKYVVLFYSLNQYLLSLTWWIALALCLLNGFVVFCFVLCVH